MLLDYTQLNEGRGCNYWEWDPTLQFEAHCVYPDEEFGWVEDVLTVFGHVLDHRVADTADRIDKTGHRFQSFDTYSSRLNDVEYHLLIHEQEEFAHEDFVLTHDAFHAPPGRDNPSD